MSLTLPVGVSNRHFHLAQSDLERLFGSGYQLTKLKDISQKGQFAAQETLTVLGPKGKLENVRLVGPTRGQTQLEISRSDAIILGINPPVRYSGDLKGSAGVRLVGPKGELELKEGVIIPQRHVHMSPEDAKRFEVRDRDRAVIAPVPKMLAAGSEDRAVIFDNVLIRVDKNFVLDFHLDTDEANAAGLVNGDKVRIVGKSSHTEATEHKKLITENDVRRAMMQKRRIKVPAGAKVTPAAAELAKAHKVFI
ncbi:phosphate propanoyltransferase [candidate division KSB1 bacterium]|nr:phosphate propanoyltransferase [candidate division KSB1 bacterium]